MPRPTPQISTGRKVLYYAGQTLLVIGVGSFLYTFVAFLGVMKNFGQSSGSFDGDPSFSNGFGPFKFAIIGIVLIILGNVLRTIGLAGAAGSGLVLNPEKARQDLSPYSSALGGVAADALGSMRENLDEQRVVNSSAAPAVGSSIMVRCPACHELSPETAAFCSHCGQKL